MKYINEKGKIIIPIPQKSHCYPIENEKCYNRININDSCLGIYDKHKCIYLCIKTGKLILKDNFNIMELL